jgi:hypothetical protein
MNRPPDSAGPWTLPVRGRTDRVHRPWKTAQTAVSHSAHSPSSSVVVFRTDQDPSATRSALTFDTATDRPTTITECCQVVGNALLLTLRRQK